ncbi:MAG: glycosyltransferase [Bacteroidia bacterium]
MTAANFPLASIRIITYQNADFIRRCIDSVLMQKTTFPFEICIGEDGSTDGTRETCMEYAENYPEKIRLFLWDRNDERRKGMAPSRFNFLNTISQCRGKYIALLDGDDSWTDKNKLQEQVTFLEDNPEFALCFTNIRLVNQSGNITVKSLLNYKTDEFTHESFVAKISPPTLTTIFRKNALPLNYPDEFYKVTNADMFLKSIISQSGKVKFINKVTGNKCLHGSGVYAGTSPFKKEENKLKTYQAMLKYFKSKKVKNNIKSAMNIIYAKLLFNYLKQRKFKPFFNTLSATLRFYTLNLQAPPIKFFYAQLRNKKSSILSREKVQVENHL